MLRRPAYRRRPTSHGVGRTTVGSLSSMRSYWPLILLLAAMWGASYLFIKVAVEDIPPAAMTEFRVSRSPGSCSSPTSWRMGRLAGRRRASRRVAARASSSGRSMRPFRWAWSRGVRRTSTRASPGSRSRRCRSSRHFSVRASCRTNACGRRIAGVALGLMGVAVLHGMRHGAGMLGNRRHARRRSLVALVRGRRRLRPAAGSRHPGAGARNGQHARRGASCSPHWRSSTRRPPLPERPRSPASSALILIPTFAGQLLLFRVLRLFGSRKLSIVTYLMPAIRSRLRSRAARRAGDGGVARRLRAHPRRRRACARASDSFGLRVQEAAA